MNSSPVSMVPPDMDARLENAALYLPSHMREGLLLYLRHGLPPGHFLMAVLSNDLAEACARADDENRRLLYDYVYFLYNHAPRAAWGSPENVEAWMASARSGESR